MKISKNIIYAVSGGALLALSFPPLPLYLFAFIGLVPILYMFEQNEMLKRKYSLLYLAFLIFCGGTNWWISSWRTETDPYLFISGIAVWLGHPVFFLVPFVFYFFVRKHLGRNTALLSFPFIWTAFEWAHSLGELSYPWLTLGNSQINNYYWIQFIDITGVWGASFAIVLVNVMILKAILNFKENRPEGKIAVTSFFKYAKSKIEFSIIWAVFVLPIIYGFFISKSYDYDKLVKSNKCIDIGVIQPNIDPWSKWQISGMGQIQKHLQIQDSLIKTMGSLDLCVWSETAVPYIDLSINQHHEYPFLQEKLDSQGTSLLTGFSHFKFFKSKSEAPPTARIINDDTNLVFMPYNSACLINPAPYNEKNPQLYFKSKLTPFAERLPYADNISFAANWFKWGVGISGWGLGSGAEVMELHNAGVKAKIGCIICIESIYPDFCAEYTRKGAQVLSVITNDAWYDFTAGPEQHYQIAAVRAIENRRFIARAANTGISGFIMPDGQSLLRAEQYTAAAIAASIPLMDEVTIWSKHPSILPYICSIVVFIIFVYCFITKFKKKNA